MTIGPRLAAAWPLFASLAVLGCNASQGPAPGTTAPPATDPLVRSIRWAPCPLFSVGHPDGPMADCGQLDVPLRHQDLEGPTLPLWVKRYRGATVAPTRQLVMLAGGPGGSGMLYEQHAAALVAADPALEVYLPDHRGTGHSARLSCPTAEAEDSDLGFFVSPDEWPDCIAEVQALRGDTLDAYTTTNAAHDLGVLVASVHRDGVRPFVFGGSYGTYWALRYLQLFPAQAAGAILDATAPPGASLARQDEDADAAGTLLLTACAGDPVCSGHLGADPRARVLALYRSLDQGHCPQLGRYGPPHVLLRRAFGQMMMGYGSKMLIPPVVARAERCTAADATAVLNLLDFYFKGGDETTDELLRQWGWFLSYYVTLSELWEPGVTVEQLAATRDAAAICRDVTEPLGNVLAVMPRYPADAFIGAWPSTTLPLLMIQGTWDPATLYTKATSVRDHFHGPGQTWITIPRGGHGSLLTDPTHQGTSCGTALVLSFLASPDGTVDTSCVGDLLPLDFDSATASGKLLLGTVDLWGQP